MSEKPTKSALSESESKPGSASVNPESGRRIRNFRKNRFNEKAILDRLLKGNKTALISSKLTIQCSKNAIRVESDYEQYITERLNHLLKKQKIFPKLS